MEISTWHNQNIVHAKWRMFLIWWKWSGLEYQSHRSESLEQTDVFQHCSTELFCMQYKGMLWGQQELRQQDLLQALLQMKRQSSNVDVA